MKPLICTCCVMTLFMAAVQADAGIVVADEDFEGGATGWSNNATRNTQPAFTEFLGVFHGPDEADRTVSKTFALSGAQTGVTIEFDFYEIDSWDSEVMSLFIDGSNVPVISDTFHVGNYDDPALATPLQGPPPTNLGFFGSADQTYRYSLSVPTTATSLELMFDFGLNSGPDEGAGLDNVFIMEVPEPTAAVLFGLAMACLGWQRRRRPA